MFKIITKYLIAILLSTFLINSNSYAFHKEGNSEKHIPKVEGTKLNDIRSQYCTQQVEESFKTIDIKKPKKKNSEKEQTTKERLEEIDKENSEEILNETKKEAIFVVSSYHAAKFQEAPKELNFSILKNQINKAMFIGEISTIETLLNYYCVQENPAEGKSKKFKNGNKKLYDEIAAINGYENRESKIEGDIFDTGIIFLSIEGKKLIYSKAQFIINEENRLIKKAEDDAEKIRLADEAKAKAEAIKKEKDKAISKSNEAWISENKRNYIDEFNKKLNKYQKVIDELVKKRKNLNSIIKEHEKLVKSASKNIRVAFDDLRNRENAEINKIKNEIRDNEEQYLLASINENYQDELNEINDKDFESYPRFKTLIKLIDKAEKSNKATDFVGKDGFKITLPKILGGGSTESYGSKIGFIKEFKDIENKKLGSGSDEDLKKINEITKDVEDQLKLINDFIINKVEELNTLDQNLTEKNKQETQIYKYIIYFVIFLVIVGIGAYIFLQRREMNRIKRESEEKVGSLKSDLENKLKDTSEQIKSVSKTAAAVRSQQAATTSIPEPVQETPKTPEEIIAIKYDELVSDYNEALNDFSKVATFKQKWNGLALSRKERQDGSKTILISASRAFEKAGIWCVSFDDKYFAFPGSTVKSNMATYMNMDFMKASQDFKGVFGITTGSTYSTEPAVLRKSGAGFVVERVGKIAFPD
jgi:hypothetical protein